MTVGQLASPPTSPKTHNGAGGANQFQKNLVNTARMWAAGEVGSAMAHRLNEPLTALLLYLHDMKVRASNCIDTDTSAIGSLDLVERAIHETERLCQIVEDVGCVVTKPVDTDTAIARGREVIESLIRSDAIVGSHHAWAFSAQAIKNLLTQRENEVLALITAGATNKSGGHSLGISTRTFEVHRAHVMSKLGAKNAADLVRLVMSEGR